MNPIKKYLLCLLFFSASVHAQVIVNTTLIPPTSSKVTDFSSPAKITVMCTNPGQAVVAYPQVRITGNNGITLASVNNPSLYNSSSLMSNVPVMLTSTQLSQLFSIGNLVVTGMSAQQQMDYRNTGQLPDGVYSLCIEMWDNRGTGKISNPAPNGCGTWIIGTGNSYANSLREPPRPIMPACQTNVVALEPQQLIFTWLDPSAFSDLTKGTQSFMIKMVEVPLGKNPYDAIAQTSVPPFFQKTVLGTSYVYNLSDPPLRRGAKYAYVIAVTTDNKKYQNKGVSEVCWFTYGEEKKETKPSIASTTVPKPKPVVDATGIKFTPPIKYEMIPTTTIKGRLVYAFQKSEAQKMTTPSVGDMAKEIGKNVDFKNMGMDNISSEPDFFITGAPPSDQSNTSWETGSASVSGSASASPVLAGSGTYSVSELPPAMGDVFTKKEAEQSNWDSWTSYYAENAGADKFPLSNSTVEVKLYMKQAFIDFYMKMKKTNPFATMPPFVISLGSTQTDKNGNFSITYNKGDIGFDFYYAEIDVLNTVQFDFPNAPVPITISNFGTYDFGEILGLANTFRLNVKVNGAFGKIDNAQVRVLRTNGFYGDKSYLDPEGNRFYGGNTSTPSSGSSKKEEDPKKQVQTPAPKGMEDLTSMTKKELVAEDNVSRKFYRLFEAADPGELYILQISAENHKSLETPLYFIPNGDLNFGGSGTSSSTKNGMMTVNATYFLQPEKPKFKGRVIDKEHEVAIPGVTVTLYSEEADKLYTTVTGKDGKFTIKNIEASSAQYTILLTGPGIKEYKDPNKVVFDKDGIVIERDPLYVHAQLIPVMGTVTNLENEPLDYAELKWKNGGNSFYSASNGHFIAYNVAGKQTLIVSHPGYKSKEVVVDLEYPATKVGKVSPTGTPSGNGITLKDVAKAIDMGQVVSTSNGTDYLKYSATSTGSGKLSMSSPASIIDIISQEGKMDNTLIDIWKGIGGDIPPGITIDTIKLTHFFVKVSVKDKDTKDPLNGAVVTVNDDEKEFKTDASGIAVVNNVPEESSSLFVSAPPGTNYVAASVNVAVQPSKDTTYVEVLLGGGAKLSGKVTAKGSALKDAEVFVEGKAYIKTKTNESGEYTLGVPVGEFTIIASKTGLVADKKTLTFEKKDYTQDFELKDPGFDASKILGFDLILWNSTPGDAPGEFKIIGDITHIPSNTVCTISNSKKLHFEEQVVVKKGSIIVPKSGSLRLAETSLDFKLFDYLNVTFKNPDGLEVLPNGGDDKGVISAEMLVDVGKTFGSKYGLKWPDGAYKILQGSAPKFNAFYSNASPVSAELKFSGPATGWDVFGVKFVPDFSNTKVDKNGISFAGSIKLDGIPGLGTKDLQIKTFQIGLNGDIKKLELVLTPNPELSFLSWKMILKDVSLNQYGLRFGGSLSIPIPGSDPAIFTFSDVTATKSGLSGGSYKLSGSINFFNLANFKGLASNPLSFGKVPGTSNYKINGGGTLAMSSLLNKSIDVKDFLVTTAGDFGFTAEPNLNFDFASGLATFKLNSIGIYPTKKEFSIDGGFNLAIPGIGAGASASIHYTPSEVIVDKFGINVGIASIGKFDANIGFSKDKFIGVGHINIASIGGMGMNFTYAKSGSGKLIQAGIETGISVPIGNVTLENIGGEMTYNSGAGEYGFKLTGRMTLAPGTGAVVALEELVLGVRAKSGGPEFFGSAKPSVISTKVGTAEFLLSIPERYFMVNANLGQSFNIIPGVSMSASGSFMLAASAKASDPFWLMGLYTQMNMLGIFNSNLNITGAWNLNRALHPEYNTYTTFIPEPYLNSGKINGLHCLFNSHQGISPDHPKCGGVSGIAELCAFAYADMGLRIHSNFASGTYGFDVNQSWGAGGSANFFGVGVAGATVGIGFNLSGGYGGGNWFIKGKGGADATAYIGCSPGGCSTGLSWGCCFDPCYVIPFTDACDVCPCPCGGSICLKPSVNVSYSSADGNFDLSMDW